MDILPVLVFFVCIAALLGFRYLSAGSRRQEPDPLKTGKARITKSEFEPVVVLTKTTLAGGPQPFAPEPPPDTPTGPSSGEFTRIFGSDAAEAQPVSQSSEDTLIAVAAAPSPYRPSPLSSPPPPAMAIPAAAKSSFRDLHRPVMAVVVTIAVMGLCIYAIVSQQYDEDGRRWAYGTLGMIIGYWLKP
jgi:hypothetical protein